MEDFIEMNESVLGEYVDLSVGCLSHDTLERVVSMVNPDFLKELKLSFEASSETTDFSKLIAVDGKTIRGTEGNTNLLLILSLLMMVVIGLALGR